MIFFIRSSSIETDSRLQKYIKFCRIESVEYKVLGWNKESNEKDSRQIKYFNSNFKLGKKWANLFVVFQWWFFVFSALFKERHKISHVHTVDLDCGIVGLFFSLCFKKKHIYDVYDVFTENRNIKGRVKSVLNKLERFICMHSSAFILPEFFRLEQLGLKDVDVSNCHEIENVPFFEKKNGCSNSEAESSSNNNVIIVYAGSLEPLHRGIENLLISVSRNSNFTLKIAGIGPLSFLCEEYSKNYNNIIFYGKLTPEKVYALESESDIIAGLYYKTRDNHLYASPNKYYEHLAFGKPLLTTEGVPPGIKVIKNSTGYAIGENLEDLENWMNSVQHKNDFSSFGKNAYNLWEEKYQNYFHEYFFSEYKKILGDNNV